MTLDKKAYKLLLEIKNTNNYKMNKDLLEMQYDTKGYYYHFLKESGLVENLESAIQGKIIVTPKGIVAINNYKLERKQRIILFLTFVIALLTLIVSIVSCV